MDPLPTPPPSVSPSVPASASLYPAAPADLLPDPPDPLAPILTRPLALHAGHAYAAAWSRRDLTTTERSLVLVRDDGETSRPRASDDALIRLAARPPLPADRLWSPASVNAYRHGRRPAPAAVFAALTAAFDRFIDFTGSLADQATLCAFLATYVLATWFLPALPTFSHLWILGDTGAGKSRLLHLLARLAHLGLVVPPTALIGPLRDLASLGAALAVDNADGLFASLVKGATFRFGAATQRQNLFLAGARRDVLFPLRQRLSPRGQPAVYGLTHLDVFGPRLFAANFAPPAAVASRALYLPLFRSADRARCAADPEFVAAWPVSPRDLLDDLWALSLAHLPELPAHLAAITAATPLAGAYFQTWQPFLAVASWLTAHGVPGLHAQIRALASDYEGRIEDLAPQAADPSSLVIQAIYGFVAMQIDAIVKEYNPPEAVDADDELIDVDDDDDDSEETLDSDDALEASFNGNDTHDTSEEMLDDADTDDALEAAFNGDDTHDTSEEMLDDADTDDTLEEMLDDRDADDTLKEILSGRAASGPAPTIKPGLLARLRVISYFFAPSMLLTVMRQMAETRSWYHLSDSLSPTSIGQRLVQLGLRRQREGSTRFYSIRLPELERFLTAYRIRLPPLLSIYPRFGRDTLRASLPPGSPGALPQPPSPAVLTALTRLLRDVPDLLGPSPDKTAKSAQPSKGSSKS